MTIPSAAGARSVEIEPKQGAVARVDAAAPVAVLSLEVYGPMPVWDNVIIICRSCDITLPLDADEETVLAAQLLTFLAAHWECEPLRE